MKNLKSIVLAGLMAILPLAAMVAPAEAAYVTVFADNAPPNISPKCDADATPAQTFATTTYATVTNASCTFTPSRNDPTGAALQGAGLSTTTSQFADQIWAEWNADVTKATATTGTCALYVNGAVLATSSRTIGYAGGENELAFSGFIPNTTVGAQTISLQCKSGDTNTFTVNYAHLLLLDVTRFPLTN